VKRAVNREIILPIRPEYVLKRLGYNRANLAQEPLVNKLMGIISEARGLLEPRAVYVDTDVISREDLHICLEEKLILRGKNIAELLKRSVRATVFAGTVGKDITEEVENRSLEDRPDEALYLDAIGSEAAEELARLMHRWAHHRAKREKMSVTARFSPGYGDLPLEVQLEILEYTAAEEIDINCNEYFLLSPRKSVTGIIGWNSRD